MAERNMGNGSEGAGTQEGGPFASAGRVVYLVADQDAGLQGAPQGMDVLRLLRLAWEGRWTVIACALLFAGIGVTYGVLAPKWFQATVLLAPVEKRDLPAGLGQLAGLAGIAGISLSSSGTAESIATLRSREFLAEFIGERNLLPVLFADRLGPAGERWWSRGDAGPPDMRDATKYFAGKIMRVAEDKRTGLVSLSVDWKDPDLASEWANLLVVRVNEKLRKRAEREAQRNIEHLTQQLSENRIVGVQQSIGRVLESELQKLMLARGASEFAFRVIDPATPPKQKVRPQRILIVLLAMVFGGGVGLAIVVTRGALSRRAPASAG